MRKARREAGGSDLEGRQQGALAARETVLAIAAAWFPDAQARAFRERVDVAREHRVEAVERWLASKSAVAVVEPRPSCPAPKAGGGLEEPQPGCETASPVPTALEVAQPRPSGESASPAVERWPAPAASEMAELRPGVEAA